MIPLAPRSVATAQHTTRRVRARISAVALALALGASATVSPLSPLAHAQDAGSAPNVPQTAREQQALKQQQDREVQELLNATVPQDVDGLLDHVGKVSHHASRISDEVKQIEIDLQETQARIDRARARLDKINQRVSELTNSMEKSRGRMGDVSTALYNGATASELSALVRAPSPDEAVERSGYLATIADSNDAAVKAAERDLEAVSDAHNAAARARTTAQFQERKLISQQNKLNQQNEQLSKLKDIVMEAVDGLGPEDRERWVAQNGPIDIDLESFLKRPELSNAGSSNGTNAKGVVAAALSKLGSPYGWGSAGPDEFDCSGLMYWAYQQNGQTIPRTSQAQLSGGTSVSRNDVQPGDLVAYYPGATHIGMYIGDGKIVHASDYGIPVQVVSVDSMPIAGISRY